MRPPSPPLPPPLGEPAPTPEGIWSVADGRVGLGVVALIASPQRELLLVRKAERPGYAFSGLWALPGGMVRTRHGDTWADALWEALRDRVQAEAGLAVDQVRDWRWIELHPPPTTSYHARGATRHTLVLGVAGQVDGATPPSGDDPSISERQWMSPVGRWRDLAPANCLIVASWCWPYLDEGQRREALPAVNDARAQCSGWAVEAGVAPVGEPWQMKASR